MVNQNKYRNIKINSNQRSIISYQKEKLSLMKDQCKENMLQLSYLSHKLPNEFHGIYDSIIGINDLLIEYMEFEYGKLNIPLDLEESFKESYLKSTRLINHLKSII